MLDIFDCEQGSEEWMMARLGIPTASEFNAVMSKGRGKEPSKTRRTYMLKLVGERLTGELAPGYSNAHMERGKEMEADAAKLYEFSTDNKVDLVGFMRNGEVGCSPDRLVGSAGLVEIKTKLPHLQLEVLEADKVPSEHIKQIQGQLWVSEREWCDFVSYWPNLPLFIKRAYRDDALIKEISDSVARFLDELHAIENKYRL